MGRFHGLGRSPERRCLPVAEWPPTDQRLWRDSLQPGNIIDGSGSRAAYRPASNPKVEKGYGRWLTFAARSGFLHVEPPARRITPDWINAYVAELREFENGRHSILSRLQELYEAALVTDPAERKKERRRQ